MNCTDCLKKRKKDLIKSLLKLSYGLAFRDLAGDQNMLSEHLWIIDQFLELSGCYGTQFLGQISALINSSEAKKRHILYRNPQHSQSGCKQLILNGEVLPDNYLPFALLREENEIICIMS